MKTCLIVGGDSSLGAAVASLFRSERYRVLTTSRRTTRTNDSSILRIDLDTTNNAQSYKGHIGSLDALFFALDIFRESLSRITLMMIFTTYSIQIF